ncbi:transmembrane protease serine 9-like isoform X1 [Pocillopora damicornis]|uniref:transmembrane protease serine 9-like isoform X1 n=1 Tax=Pocillopora damicornis TaxID=46731 RepID=UPI000F558D7A|nr:transmembrane protease serine 9-like isoform X1 [Pocillopora damicornis]
MNLQVISFWAFRKEICLSRYGYLMFTLLVISLALKGLAYDEFDKECVRVHNQLRALHNASALCWSESLAGEAQKWAENLANRDRVEHDYQDLITKGQGENIAWINSTTEKCEGPKKPGCVGCGDIVKKWYSEGKNYDFQKGAAIDPGQPVHHFNQIVWKSTTELGMGSARSNEHGLIIVARYSPMGSTGGTVSFLQNVVPSGQKSGNVSLDTTDQNTKSKPETTVIKITKVVQKFPQGINPEENETQAPTTSSGPNGNSMTCGIRKPSRIVGGEVAYPGAWPWQAGFKRDANDIIFCGGSLINKEWIATASHCVYDLLSMNKNAVLVVKLGEFDKANKEEQEISVKTKKIIMHPNYNFKTLDYDIALVQLEEPLKEFSTYIRPVCMPDGSETFDEQSKCYVTGFGRTQQGGELAGMLRMAKIPLVSKKTCKQAYGEKLTDRMICAGFPKGGIDACQGDSGGPLSCLHEGRWYLTGVVSWGVGCAQPNAYGVYSKVQVLKDWVQATIKANE